MVESVLPVPSLPVCLWKAVCCSLIAIFSYQSWKISVRI